MPDFAAGLLRFSRTDREAADIDSPTVTGGIATPDVRTERRRVRTCSIRAGQSVCVSLQLEIARWMRSPIGSSRSSVVASAAQRAAVWQTVVTVSLRLLLLFAGAAGRGWRRGKRIGADGGRIGGAGGEAAAADAARLGGESDDDESEIKRG